MRLALPRARMGAIGWAVCVSVLAGLPAHAANSNVFPVPSHLVTAAVMAAFVLPAMIASALSVIRRASKSPLGRISLCAVGGGVLAAIGYANPDLVSGLRI